MSKAQTICIIDDEITLRDVVRRYLAVDGFNVIEADSGTSGLALLREKHADLILLDVMLPGSVDGFSLARTLRNSSEFADTQSDVPIIMLTSRGDEVDRLVGFDLGVDDYVVKPFSPRELVARVKAVLRRAASEQQSLDKPISFKHLQIDPIRRVVTLKGQSVVLTAREFDLLWLFARHPQQVFTREQLLNQVWGYEFYGDESTVTVHIRRLREKIEIDPAQPAYLQTVWGVGYKFEPEI
ncbi:MAG: response regulator transcription factor [Chloroflexi bacterium]|nr:response regulator transcription factor [Chloroflexota bacterium]MCC6896515.1 response regulator transcription factor [Anaerolineae bacterium]